MSKSEGRSLAVAMLKSAGFEVARKRGKSKHEKLRHPDGRSVVVGFKTNDRHLLNKVLKTARIALRV